MLRLIGICLAVLVLAGCGSTQQLGVSEKFAASSPDALLIVGYANRPWNGSNHGLRWQAIDPETGTFVNTEESAFVSTLSSWQGESVVYFIHRVPPGTYALDRMFGVDAQVGNIVYTYNVRFRPTTSAVQVAAGEIVYVGDFQVSAGIMPQGLFKAVKRDRSFKYTGYNITEVRKKLEAYPNVSGDVVYRKPRRVELRLPVEQ